MKTIMKRITALLCAVVMLLPAFSGIAVHGAETVPDAVTAVEAYLASFTYEEDGRRYFESCGGWEFWQCAESLEAVIDAYDQTGDLRFLDAAEGLFAGFIAGNKTGARGTDWSGNDYNDDIMWGVIASSRLYLLTGKTYYLDVAKSNFDMCYARAWDTEFLGGGLWWRTENESKNACVQGPGAIAACLLGDATGDKGYYDKAKAIIDWTIENLYQEDGALWDSVYTPSTGREPNKWCSSYNQGTFIGACTMLSKHYNDVDYLGYAKSAAQRATRLNLNGEQNTGDLIGFKGILGRWLGYYCRESGDDSFVDFMQDWAQTIWNNRNSDDLMWTRFDSRTPEDLKNQTISDVDAGSWGYWGCSAAVAWLVNTPGSVREPHRVTGISADDAVSVPANEAVEIGVTLEPLDTQARGLIWQVEDLSIAKIESVSDNGAVIKGLKEGTTSVHVTAAANDAVTALIQVEVTPSRFVIVPMEAEEGLLSEGASVSNNANASGGKHVGNLGEEDNDTVTFSLNCPIQTDAELRLWYATAQTREYGVTVNSGEKQTASVGSTGGWINVSEEPLTMQIRLHAGENTIVVGGTGGPAPNLDKIEIVYLAPVAVSGITLDKTELELYAGESLALNAEVAPEDAYDKTVLWSSGDEAVAKVENGLVTAVGPGTAEITASAGEFSAVCRVTVRELPHEMVCLAKDFADVDLDAWYHGAVDFVLERGIMSGNGDGTFTPEEPVTRAMLVQILYNREGRPGGSGGPEFADVAEGEWYFDAISWAAEQGIVLGHDDGTFGPEDCVTREQMVTILWRYMGCRKPENAELPFDDASDASDWAVEPIAWAVENGVVKGTGANRCEPKANTERAAIAQVMLNLFG